MTNLSRRSVRHRFAFVPFAGDAEMCIGLNFTTCRPSALPGISLTRSPYRLSAAIVHELTAGIEARGLTGDRADDFAGVAVPMPCPLRIPATRMPRPDPPGGPCSDQSAARPICPRPDRPPGSRYRAVENRGENRNGVIPSFNFEKPKPGYANEAMKFLFAQCTIVIFIGSGKQLLKHHPIFVLV